MVARIMRIEIMHDHVDKDSEYGGNWANHEIDAEDLGPRSMLWTLVMVKVMVMDLNGCNDHDTAVNI